MYAFALTLSLPLRAYILYGWSLMERKAFLCLCLSSLSSVKQWCTNVVISTQFIRTTRLENVKKKKKNSKSKTQSEIVVVKRF